MAETPEPRTMTRLGWTMATSLVSAGIGVSALLNHAPRFIWNATASTPIGLYELQSSNGLKITDLVAVRPPDSIARVLAKGNYLPLGVPLLKRVLALPGQMVCRFDLTITIDGRVMSEARTRDSRGRDLPIWQGCRTIAGDQLFLMNPDVPDSLDGRYFGPLPASSIIGRAKPLLTDEDNDGRFTWRASVP
jgi:conjugative transfer signal peptidase TraF